MIVVVLPVRVEADAGVVQRPQDLGVAAEEAEDQQRQHPDDDGEQEDDGAHETLPKVRTPGVPCWPRSRRPVSAVRAAAAATAASGATGSGRTDRSNRDERARDTAPASALASASVHFAEMGTNGASGLSHWRLGNVDWKLVGIGITLQIAFAALVLLVPGGKDVFDAIGQGFVRILSFVAKARSSSSAT